MKIGTWATLFVAAKLAANPTDPIVVQGEAVIVERVGVLEIQASDKSVIDWASFSIGSGEKTQFHQPGADSSVLNRVQGSSHSQIDGMLEANGRVYLMNPHGVIIGKDGVVIASDFAATTQEIVDLENWHEVFNRSSCLHFDSLPGQGVINCGGTIQAVGMREEGGRVLLVGSETEVAGRIEGKDVWVLGENIRIAPECLIEAPNGSIQIGGDYQGGDGSIPNSRKVIFEEGAQLLANGGGKVILWSDEETQSFGKIEARGGELHGDGGFVEISSKERLVFKSSVDTRAPFGKHGMLLLDPSDITIQNTLVSNPALTTPVYNPAVMSAVLLDTDIQTALATTDLTITTSAGSMGNGDITFQDGVTISWNSAHSLTLLANRDIFFTPAATGIVLSNAGTGDILFTAAGSITLGDLGSTATSFITTGGDLSFQAVTGMTLNGTAGIANVIDFYSTSPTGTVTLNASAGDILVQHFSNMGRIGIGYDSVGGVAISGTNSITAPAGSITFQVGPVARGIGIGSVDRVEIIAKNDIQFITGINPSVGDQILIQVDSVTGNTSRIESAQGSVICDFDTGQNAWTFNNSFLQVTAAVDWSVHDTGPGQHLFPIAANSGISATVGRDIIFQDLMSGGLLFGVTATSGNIDFTAGGNITLDGGANNALIVGAFGPASTTILTAGGDIFLQNTNPIINGCTPLGPFCCIPLASIYGTAGTTLEAGGSISINEGGRLLSGADGFVFARANQNISLNGNAIIDVFDFSGASCGNTVAGKNFYVTLVVDNQAPTPPQAGNGQFNMSSNAQIMTAGSGVVPVQIFTAFRSQNTVDGLINGAPFVPGPFNVDTDTERWGVWYPDPFVGSPFTIFYKEGAASILAPVAAIFGDAFDTLSDFALFGRFLPPYFDDHFIVHFCYPFSPKPNQISDLEKRHWNWIQVENYRKFYPERDQYGYINLSEDYFIPDCQ